MKRKIMSLAFIAVVAGMLSAGCGPMKHISPPPAPPPAPPSSRTIIYFGTW